MTDHLGDNVSYLRNGPIGPVPNPQPDGDSAQILRPVLVLAVVMAAMLFGYAVGRAGDDPVTVVLVLLGYAAGWLSAAAVLLWFRRRFRRWLRGG